MCNTSTHILPDPNPVCNPEIPGCPAGCGPLHINTSARRVVCPVCDFTLSLTAAEARDLALAIAGIDPDLRLDLFLAEIARREWALEATIPAA